ncbi:MAG: FAD-dependent monooxygenase [Hyphomicrobiales bacterium]
MNDGNGISCEILIVGGGLTGLAAACTLAGPANRFPFDVVMVDAGHPAAQHTAEFDGRASAITATGRRMFEALGIWQALEADAQPMNEIAVTDSRLDGGEKPEFLHFGEETQPGGPASYMIENRHMYGALYDKASTSKSLRIIARRNVEELNLDGPRASVRLDNGTAISCAVIAAADGRNSPARHSAGISTSGWSYPQMGIVTTVEHERPHNGVAEENFLPAGPFAILPLTGNRSSLVWTEQTVAAKKIMSLDEAGFKAELERRFGDHLGGLTIAGPRHAYPLAMHIADNFAGPRLALIGDAAHVVHPIAGLGFNLALRDIAALTDVLADQARLGLDIGAADCLEKYENWRRFDTVKVALMSDGLNRLFSNDFEPVRRLRDLGLGMVDKVEPAKRFFMREAAGLNGNLPSLMQR